MRQLPALPYCFVGSGLGIAQGSDGSRVPTIPPGGTGSKDFSRTYYDQTFSQSFVIPEAQLSAVLQDVRNPSFWLLIRSFPDNYEPASAAGVCDAGYTVVATSGAGLATCVQGVQ